MPLEISDIEANNALNFIANGRSVVAKKITDEGEVLHTRIGEHPTLGYLAANLFGLMRQLGIGSSENHADINGATYNAFDGGEIVINGTWTTSNGIVFTGNSSLSSLVVGTYISPDGQSDYRIIIGYGTLGGNPVVTINSPFANFTNGDRLKVRKTLPERLDTIEDHSVPYVTSQIDNNSVFQFPIAKSIHPIKQYIVRGYAEWMVTAIALENFPTYPGIVFKLSASASINTVYIDRIEILSGRAVTSTWGNAYNGKQDVSNIKDSSGTINIYIEDSIIKIQNKTGFGASLAFRRIR